MSAATRSARPLRHPARPAEILDAACLIGLVLLALGAAPRSVRRLNGERSTEPAAGPFASGVALPEQSGTPRATRVVPGPHDRVNA